MIGGTGVPSAPQLAPLDPNNLLGLDAKANPNTVPDNTNFVLLITLMTITVTTILGNVSIAIFKEGDVLGLISAVSAIGVLVATALIALLKQGQELHKTVNSRMGEMIGYVQQLAAANATLAARKEADERAAALAIVSANALAAATASIPPGGQTPIVVVAAAAPAPAPAVQDVHVTNEVVPVDVVTKGKE